jgi:hypothetical protein
MCHFGVIHFGRFAGALDYATESLRSGKADAGTFLDATNLDARGEGPLSIGHRRPGARNFQHYHLWLPHIFNRGIRRGAEAAF